MDFSMFKPIPLGDKRYDQISDYVIQSYTNACILYIDEIYNPTLSDRYESQKQELIKQRGRDKVTDCILFHGTSEQCAMSIARNGYNANMNKVAAYGLGTYFASTATGSLLYTKDNKNKECFMFVNKVIMGELGKYTKNQKINTDLHDNSVDKIINPSIIVSPYNYGALPMYLVAFYKHAK